jgi:hypothetical protein
VRIDVPELDAMRAVNSCAELWMRLNNDRVFQFERYLLRTSGRDVTLRENRSAADWAQARRLIVALDRGAQLASRLLGAEPGWDEVEALQDWIARVPAGRHGPEAQVFALLLEALEIDWFGIFGRRPERVDELFRVRAEEVEDEELSRAEFDAFISYTHRRFSEPAQRLYDALSARGHACWLDRRELRLSGAGRVENVVLKRRLRHALAACRHTVFFEMAAEATVDYDVRGHNTAFLWQSFEHRYARGLVYVRPGSGGGSVDAPGGERLAEWGSVDELAGVLSERFRGVAVSDPAPEPGPRRGDEPDLVQARLGLTAQAAEHFGRPVELTPMAVLALLGPGAEEQYAYGDDLLINLLRQDPLAALWCADAGLDLQKLFAAGVEINHRRWIAPRPLLLGDAFGYPEETGGARAELAGRDVLGAGDILRGLLCGAKAGHYQRGLLDRTLRWMHPDDTPEASGARCTALVRDLMARTASAGDRLGRHGWLFTPEGGGWRADAVIVCGEHGAAAVLQRQSTRLLPAALGERLGAAVAAGEAPADLHGELALTLTGSLFASAVARVSAPGADAATWLFALARAARVGEGATPTPDDLAACLTLAAERADTPLDTPFGPLGWNPALLAVDALPAPADAEATALDLALDIVGPLAAHAFVRELEFDDV